MRLGLVIFFLAILTGTQLAPSARSSTREYLLPPNNLSIPASHLSGNGVDEKMFHAILTQVEAIYAPMVAARGGHLTIDKRWQDPIVNAWADRDGNDWIVTVYGGIARHDLITADAVALLACHEIGHHLGGAPKPTPRYWGSVESQADYFAPLKCLRAFFSRWPVDERRSVDPTVATQCQQAFVNSLERRICERSAMAGLSADRLYQFMNNEALTNRFDTPDATVVAKTEAYYPSTQCRLDTYLQASLCPASLSTMPDDRDPNVGACAPGTPGARPLCWYKP
jgi:hypothetical protein